MRRGTSPAAAREAVHLSRRHVGALAVLAVPVALAAAVTLALPRYLAAQETKTLRAMVTTADAHTRDLFADGTLAAGRQPPTAPDPRIAQELQQLGDDFRAQEMSAALRALTGPVRYDIFGQLIHVSGPDVAVPEGVPPQVGLSYRSDVAAHIRYVQGAAPSTVSPGPDGGPAPGVVDVGISADAARAMHIAVGTVLDTRGVAAEYQLRVTGIYEPVDAKEAYWADASDLIAAVLHQTSPRQESPHYWLTEVLVGPGEIDAVTALYGTQPVKWQYSVDPAGIDIADYEALRTGTKRWNGATTSHARYATLPLRTPGPTGRTGLDQVVAGFGNGAQSSVLLASLGLGGLLAVVGAAVLLAVRLLIERQRVALALMRARGGSGRQVGGLCAAQVALAAWPAAALGIVVAVRLTPDAGAVELSGLVRLALLAIAATPLAVGLRVAWLGRVARPARHRIRRPPTRLSLEALLAAVALIAWAELRSRGLNTVVSGVDPLISAVPVLIAAVGAAVVLRVYPLVVLLVAGRMARARGGIAFMGAAQAGRGRTASAAATPVLLVAVGLAVFGSVLTATVDQGRETAAWRQVGADVRIDAANTDPTQPAAALDPAGLAKLRQAPGVSSLLPARREAFAQISGGTDNLQVTAFATDPGADADLIVRSPLHDPAVEQPLRALAAAAAEFPTQPPGDRTITTSVPVLVTPDLVAEFATSDARLTVQNSTFPVRLAGVIGVIPGQTPRGSVVVVPWAAGASAAASALEPNVVWVSTAGGADGSGVSPASGSSEGSRAGQASALRQAIAADLPGASAAYRDDVARELGGRGTGPLARRLFVASEVGEGGLCVIVVLLAVVLGAPSRGRTLTLLRTLGFAPRQVRALALFELLPAVVAVAVAGTGLGVGILPLIRDALDLGTLTGGEAGVRQTVDAGAVAVIAAGLVAVSAAALAAETMVLRRLQLSSAVRIGSADRE
jgi:putative ABC transport system permease protein